MLKLIICILLILIGSYIGFSMSKRFQNRIKQLELCDLLFQRIKVYLEYEKTPTKQLIQNLCENHSFEELIFLKKCSERLEDNINFPQAWEQGLEESKMQMALHKEDYEVLKQLCNILGAYEAQAQSNGISMLQKMIKIQQENAIEENKTTGKLYRSLGVLAGIALAILLI